MSIINRLNQRVTIQQRSAASDGQGGQTISWSDLATVYAEVQPISSNSTSRPLADGVMTNAGYKVTMRARSDVDASMQIAWRERLLKINSLHSVGQMLEILTYEEWV